MGRYGIDYYGVTTYGPIAPVEFSADPFVALPSNYGELHLTWNSPTGAWTEIRLVRNSYGFPLDAEDGDLLYSATKSTDLHFYDNSGLQQGRTYYFSLFVYSEATTEWIRAGNTYGVSVKDFGTFEKMYRYLPTIYRSVSQYDITSDQENTDLQDFLRLFAFEYDLEKTYSMNLMYSYDTTFVDGRYIPQIMKQFGLKFEPEIGLKQSRILLRNALKIYKSKGSRDGLTTYLKAFSGYDVVINTGKNLCLDINNSSFEESIGFWAADKATLTHNPTGTYGIVPYSEASAPSTFPNLIQGCMRAQVTAAGTVVLDGGIAKPITRGIPVVAGRPYAFSIYARASSTARSMTPGIKWYDRTGTLLTTDTAASGTSVTSGGWNVRLSVIKTAPSKAAFAVPIINISSASIGDVFYFDAAQFEYDDEVTNFEEARVLKITFKATRLNELKNPSFETNTLWTITGGSKALASTVSGAPVRDGDAFVLRPSTLQSPMILSSEQINVLGGEIYPATHTFSVYARFLNEGADPDPTDAVIPILKWYNSSNELLQTDIGETTQLTTSDWSRIFVTSLAPATTAYGVAEVSFTPQGSTSVSVVLDQALAEESPFVNSYFDGSTGVASLSNLFWEGTVNGSRSHFYQNRATVAARILTDIPNYLTAGTQYQVYFAQPS